ncbi:YqaJ viral recombinase family protein [Candidatus Pacearchaeota archaeon]|nr:YqaJ viral recombinase family protein [Candidatus Pacearchaeota archaeon]
MSDIIQGSSEWFDIKRGKISASRVIDILPGKTGYKASRKNYMAQLVCEILTGTTEETFTSGPMQWGIDNEPLARAVYEAKTGYMVTEEGFKVHDNIEGLGASPDGIIPELKKGLEIKCPNTATHLDTILNGTVKKEYIVQMTVAMMCYGYEKWDFVSFDPRLPEKHSFWMKEFNIDRALENQILSEVLMFRSELTAMVEKLK